MDLAKLCFGVLLYVNLGLSYGPTKKEPLKIKASIKLQLCDLLGPAKWLWSRGEG